MKRSNKQLFHNSKKTKKNTKTSKLKMQEKVIENNFRILKKQYAYLQTILKACVKFQKDRPENVGGVVHTRYILPIHFCSIRAQKKS